MAKNNETLLDLRDVLTKLEEECQGSLGDDGSFGYQLALDQVKFEMEQKNYKTKSDQAVEDFLNEILTLGYHGGGLETARYEYDKFMGEDAE